MKEIPGHPRWSQLFEQMPGPEGTGPALTLVSAGVSHGKTALLDQWKHNWEIQTERGVPGNPALVVVNAAGLSSENGLWERIVAALVAASMIPPSLLGSDEQIDHQLHQFQVERWALRRTAPTVVLIDSYETVTSPTLDIAVTDLLDLSPHLRLVVASRRFAVMDGPVTTARFPTAIISGSVLQPNPLAPAPSTNADTAAELSHLNQGARESRPALGSLANTFPNAASLEAEILNALVLFGALDDATLCAITERKDKEVRDALKDLESAGLTGTDWSSPPPTRYVYDTLRESVRRCLGRTPEKEGTAVQGRYAKHMVQK